MTGLALRNIARALFNVSRVCNDTYLSSSLYIFKLSEKKGDEQTQNFSLCLFNFRTVTRTDELAANLGKALRQLLIH